MILISNDQRDMIVRLLTRLIKVYGKYQTQEQYEKVVNINRLAGALIKILKNKEPIKK